MKLGERYRFKGQHELFYIGTYGPWYQFSKTNNPCVVWCELLQTELHKIEKINEKIKDT